MNLSQIGLISTGVITYIFLSKLILNFDVYTGLGRNILWVCYNFIMDLDESSTIMQRKKIGLRLYFVHLCVWWFT